MLNDDSDFLDELFENYVPGPMTVEQTEKLNALFGIQLMTPPEGKIFKMKLLKE